jgi:DNA helicase IV
MSDAATTTELEQEQSQVTMLYGWLDRLRERARTRLDRAQRADGSTPSTRVDRDAAVARYATRFVQLNSVEHGLCLGRLDHRDGSRLYVGRIGLADDDREPLLIDWRAPAAEPFYRATPADPGEIVRRRHLQTIGRRVTGFSDDVLDLDTVDAADLGNVNGEAALLAALNASRTGRMSDIVATIQAEQDEVIRAGLPGILVVQGGPGTGKTAVALHRAAFLLYTHRDRLARRGVLVLGPNRTFLRYIQQVLPSLGETDVLLSTIGRLYPGIDATASEPVAAATMKGDRRMMEVLAAAVRDRQRVPAEPIPIRAAAGDLTLDPATVELARERARAASSLHNSGRVTFAQEVIAALAEQVAGNAEQELAEIDELVDGLMADEEEQHAGPLLDDDQMADVRRDLWRDRAVRTVIDELWPDLTPERLVGELLTSPERIAVAGAALSDDERAALLRAPDAGWTTADVPLLDEAAELLGDDGLAAQAEEARRRAQLEADREYARGVLEMTGAVFELTADGEMVVDFDDIAERYRDSGAWTPLADRARQDRAWVFAHIIVDEAQELSPMAWRLLMRRCPSGSMTVVGDLAQTGAPGGARSWSEVLEPHAPGRWREARLTVNYRTPAAIMAVAAEVLAAVAPGLDPPTSVRETDHRPWSLAVEPAGLPARLAEVVTAELAAVGDGRLAVLVPAGRAGAIEAGLAAALPGLDVAGGDGGLDARVAVLTVTEAKGLEFDGVVVVEPGEILDGSPNGGNDLYVALTRATQRLGVVHTAPLPKVLSGLHPA